MDIIKYPDPVLKRGGREVESFDAELAETAKQMMTAMYRFGGVGLAAPQVGLEVNLLVLNPKGDDTVPDGEMVMVNPKLVYKKGMEWGEEGCLSFPGIYGEVERYQKIEVEYQDLEGNKHSVRANDFLARVIQHEMDHLDGVLFVERLSPVDRIRVKSKLLDMEQQYSST